MNPLVSVIVPVYNCEKYIYECVESIIDQTYESVEVLIVNDGSTDNSLKICQDISQNDKRVRVFDIERRGVSFARNFGMQHASGKWICFVDSDDWMEKTALSVMVKSCEEYECEIGIFDFFFEGVEKGRENHFYTFEKRHEFDSDERSNLLADCINSTFFSNENRAANSGVPWAKLYLKRLLDEHRVSFPDGMKRMQDMVFNLNAIKSAKRIIYCPQCIYHYRKNMDSACNRYTRDFGQIADRVLEELDEFISSSKLFFLQSEVYCKKIKLFLEWIKLEIVPKENHNSFFQKRNLIKKRAKDIRIKLAIQECEMKKFSRNQIVGVLLAKFNLWGMLCLYYMLGRAIKVVRYDK